MRDIARTTNRTVLNRILRRHLNCEHCPPNRGENAKRRPRDDRYKDHRRRGLSNG